MSDEIRAVYLLWCLECTPPDDLGNARLGCEMPFSSAEDRGRWAGQHTRGTGHDLWHVIDLPEGETLGPHHLQRGWPSSPALAAAKELLQELETLRGIVARFKDNWMFPLRGQNPERYVWLRFQDGDLNWMANPTGPEEEPMTEAEVQAIYGQKGDAT